MTDKMPRVVQTCDILDSTDDEESINANTNKCERSDGQLNLAADLTHGSKGRIILYDEVTNIDNADSLYSLRCVIDGKVKQFKKDTRVWLHKSSTKTKRKPDDENETKFINTATPRKLVKFDETKFGENTDEKEHHTKAHDVSLDISQVSENYSVYRSQRSELVSDLASLGDSDADLTYSEATTPTKTPSTCGETERTLTSQSSSSLVTNDTTSQDDIRLTDFDEPNLADDVQANSDSLESLDLCNQSTNSTMYYPMTNTNFNPTNITKTTNLNRVITRQMAPAIDIEVESIRENLLDYAVNLVSEDSDQSQCVAYRTRSASKSKGGMATRYGNPKKAADSTRKNRKSKRKSGQTANRRKSRDRPSIDENSRMNLQESDNDNNCSVSLQPGNSKSADNRTKSGPPCSRVRKTFIPEHEDPDWTLEGSKHAHRLDALPGCSTQNIENTVQLPMSLLCLATLALFRDSNLSGLI